MRLQTYMRAAALLPVALLAFVAEARAGDPLRSTLKVGNAHSIEAVLYVPEGAAPYPAILLLPTSQGTTPSDLSYCLKLAREGYACLVADFVRAHGVARNFRQMSFGPEAVPIYRDLVEVIRQMKAMPMLRVDAIGAIGFSNGGFFAIWLAATRQVRASVAYYAAMGTSADPKRFNHFARDFSPDSSPLMLFHGTVDHIPVAAVETLNRMMTGAGAPHEFHVYPYAGHEFERLFNQPGNQTAAADAWQRTDAFLKAQLQ